MILQMFQNYFTSVTNGRYVDVYPYIGNAIGVADQMFMAQNNGIGILNRPDLYDSYARMVEDALRNAGASVDLEREVGVRLREFFKVNYGVM